MERDRWGVECGQSERTMRPLKRRDLNPVDAVVESIRHYVPAAYLPLLPDPVPTAPTPPWFHRLTRSHSLWGHYLVDPIHKSAYICRRIGSTNLKILMAYSESKEKGGTACGGKVRDEETGEWTQRCFGRKVIIEKALGLLSQ